MANGGVRLSAEDEEDLRALSAALQDAVARVGDLTFDRKSRSFTALVNRFRWEDTSRPERVRAALRIDGVTKLRTRGLRQEARDAVASLLTLEFAPAAEPPGGVLRLVLSGGGEIEADVECIDVSLIDLTQPWRARGGKPEHEAD